MRNVIVTYRRLFVVLVHLGLWTFAFGTAFLLRFEFEIPSLYFRFAARWLAILLTLRCVVFWRAGLFHGLWRYSSLKDAKALFQSTSLSSALFFAGVHFLPGPRLLPRSAFILEWILAMGIVGGLRFGIRTIREIAVQNALPASGQERRKLLVLGAGDAGEMLMREIVTRHARRYLPVGFLDDNKNKHHEHIHGVPVLGSIADLTAVVERENVQEIVVAIPSMPGRELRRIVELSEKAGVTLRTLPGVADLVDGKVNVNQLQEVRIDDLLRREPVKLDTKAISNFLNDRVVLVTGAGGSIGSELCAQIARFSPRQIVLVEQAENNLFHVHRKLITLFPDLDVVPCVADICDTKRLERVFERTRPHIVFHAAAHKHVPMMEWNPGEAIKNNVYGTRKVSDLADRFGVEKFVMVSTDKAVNPTSVMGASKRVAEMYIQSLSSRSKTQFVTVRFGNVLGSAGSVIPLFKEQIEKGGPVTVTDPEMRRYFMTIPEACQLVMQAGTMGRGGEIFILDMGEPVKIVDLARDLIRLSGLVPDDDIEIHFTGLRPGEKLFEELSTEAEAVDTTMHPKILVGRQEAPRHEEVARGLERLHAVTDEQDPARIRAAFKEVVREYMPGADAESGQVQKRPARATSGSQNDPNGHLVAANEN